MTEPDPATEPDVRARTGGPTGGPTGGLSPGLHVVATPIGAARDITLRALDILARADPIMAEDTRSLRRLLEIHGLRLDGRRLWSYHDHNGAQMRPRVLAALAEGAAVALVSEAGTPLVADPGFQLVRAAIAAGHPVRAAPGASALLAALTVAGLPTDRFAFLGFPPTGGTARKRFLEQALGLEMTCVIYESPRRINRIFGELVQAGEGQRPAAMCRELTKRFEEVIRGSVDDIAAAVAGRELKGEVVLVIGAAEERGRMDAAGLDAALGAALAGASLREAVDAVSARSGLPRREVYRRALILRDGAEGEDGQ